MSNESSIFHCTTSVIVGLAKPQLKAPAKP
jgi:aralkylamine dehydrogenase light chain/methylamine dehydrogenase light chain